MSVKVTNCPTCGSTDFIQLNEQNWLCNHCGNKIIENNKNSEQVNTLLVQGRLMLNALDFKVAKLNYLEAIKFDEKSHEAYFGAFISDYGIEYVLDSNEKYVPTCHKASTISIYDNFYFQQAINYSDEEIKSKYLHLGEAYEQIRMQIINKASDILPYDIFICYKSKNNDNSYTKEHDFCMELYYELKKENKRVFFADISLQKYAGWEYEPIIYKALTTASVMFTVAFSVDNLNSTWVKNEWNRFLEIKTNDNTKKLVVIYKNISPYDFPIELNSIQAIDGERLAYLDTIRTIVNENVFSFRRQTVETENFKFNDVLPKNLKKNEFRKSINAPDSNINNLQNARNFLENGSFETSAKFYKLAIKEDKKSGEAYFGLIMAQIGAKSIDEIPANISKLTDFDIFKKTVENSDELQGFEYINIFMSALIERINVLDGKTSIKIFNEIICWVDESQVKYLSCLMFELSLKLIHQKLPKDAINVFEISLKGLSQRDINEYLERHYVITKLLREEKLFNLAKYINQRIFDVSEKLARARWEMFLSRNKISNDKKLYYRIRNKFSFKGLKTLLSKNFDEYIIDNLVNAAYIGLQKKQYEKACALFENIVMYIPTAANNFYNEHLFSFASKLMEYSKFDLAYRYFNEIIKVNNNFSRAYIGKMMCRYKVININSFKRINDDYTKDCDFISAISCNDSFAKNYEKMKKDYKKNRYGKD